MYVYILALCIERTRFFFASTLYYHCNTYHPQRILIIKFSEQIITSKSLVYNFYKKICISDSNRSSTKKVKQNC